MAIKAIELFDAYAKSLLPKEEGYIISSMFSDHSAYSRYEIVSYNNMKSIYPQDQGLTFQTDGKKMFVLVEPMNYPTKGTEPYCRKSDEQIPFRFNELDSLTAKNQTKVMVSNKAMMSYGSFTIARPVGINFSIIFYSLTDMYETMTKFFERTLNREAQVPLSDAKKSAAMIVGNIQKIMKWDFES